MRNNSPMYPVPADAAAGGASHLQWLAGLAMQSLIARIDGIPDTDAEREQVALWAYRMAQAMQEMEARIHINETETRR